MTAASGGLLPLGRAPSGSASWAVRSGASALRKASSALSIEAKLRGAARQGVIDRAPGEGLAKAGLAAGVIAETELEALHAADAAREEVIQVDAFEAVEYQNLRR